MQVNQAPDYLSLPVADHETVEILAEAIARETVAVLALVPDTDEPTTVRLGGSATSPVATIERAALATLRGRCRVTFTLHDACFLLEATFVRRSSRCLQLSPEALSLRSARRAPRVATTDRRCALHFTEEHDGELRSFSARVVDLSAGGVRVEVPPSAALHARRVLPAELDLEGRRIACLVEPRAGDATVSGTRGVRVVEAGGSNVLAEAYTSLSLPRLVPRREVAREVVTELFCRSGYLDLRPGHEPRQRWFALPGSERISRDVVYHATDGTALGHVSVVRAYERAWVGQQLATLRDHDETAACRLALYRQLALHPFLVDGEDGHLVCYFDQSKTWHQRFFGRFVDWVADPSLALGTGLDRFELEAASVPTSVRATVRVAARHEVVAVAALVRAQVPGLLAHAWDIHPERLSARSLHHDYEGTSYERGREALVLEVDGELRGVALCETSSRDLSLFNILNMAQVFFTRGRQEPTAEARGALLDAVTRYYAARGEGHPIVVAPPGTLLPSSHPGLRKEETMGCVVFSGRALGLYSSFLDFIVGQYQARKRTAKRPVQPPSTESIA